MGSSIKFNRSRGWLGFCRKISFLILSSVLFSQQAMAGESLFTYNYTADTLPKNKWELEQSYWGRYGKMHGDYANSVYRTEVEYGVTDRYQVALYTNEQHVYANRDNRDRTTGGEDVPENAARDKRYNALTWKGISIENIYRVLSPYKDPIGLALYFEPEFGPNEIELEPRLILQKNFLEDRLVITLNFWWAFEWDRETGGAEIEPVTEGGEPGRTKHRWVKESVYEPDLGVSYRFAPNWSVGFEAREHNEVSSFNPKDTEHNAFFLGPNIHYGGKRFWVTATVLFQLPFAYGHNEEQRNAITGGRLYGDEHESVETRVKFGYVF